MAKSPDGFHTVTPHLTVDGGGAAIALYEKALGAQVLGRIDMPGTDMVMHAMLQVGTSRIFLSDANPDWGKKAADGYSPVNFYLYVDDADAAYAKALDAGMTGSAEPEDMFWGDRTAVASDPYGFNWTFATHLRDVTSEEIAEALKTMGG